MINNKRVRQTLALPSSWDRDRPINQKLNNNIVVSVDADGWIWVFNKYGKGIITYKEPIKNHKTTTSYSQEIK